MAKLSEHPPGGDPLVTRVPRTPRRRLLRVTRIEQLSATMRRIWLGGDDLETDFPFAPLGAADHVKLVPPDPRTGRVDLPGPDGPRPAMRDYTIRAFDPVAKELALDCVLHSHGPAGRWAVDAVTGSEIGVLGPRGSQLYPPDCANYLLVADETGLPAAERFLEELPPDRPVHLLVLDGTRRELARRATWLAPTDDLLTAVAAVDLGPDSFAWGAGEAGVMRTLRTHLRHDRGLAADRVSVRGYWRIGTAGSVPRDEEDV